MESCQDPDDTGLPDVNKSTDAGGAKFSPMEAGLVLCGVAIPGRCYNYRGEKLSTSKAITPRKQRSSPAGDHKSDNDDVCDHDNTNDDGNDKTESDSQLLNDDDTTTATATNSDSRPERSGRYGFSNEAINNTTHYDGRNAISAILPNGSGNMILVPLLRFVIVPMEEAATTREGVRIRTI